MPRSRRTDPERDEGADIVERHLCRDGVEVALVSVPVGMFAAVLIHPGADGKPVRRPIGGQHFDRERTARRMMDMQAAVCAMQHAGFALPLTSTPDAGEPALARRRKTEIAAPAAPALPPSHLALLKEKGFEVVAFLDKAVAVDLPPVCPADEGHQRQEWLPRLAIAPGSSGGYRVLEWLPKAHPANHFAFDGWQVSDFHSLGGMYEDLHAALSWFDWIVASRATALKSPAQVEAEQTIAPLAPDADLFG